MGDEQIGQPKLGLQVFEHVDDLCLHRHIERRDRLVTDNQVGLQRDSTGNADTLALAAGELMGEAGRRIRRQADAIEQVGHGLPTRGRCPDSGDFQRLGDQLAHAHARVEAGIGILENHLHAASEGAGLALAAFADILSIEHDAARCRLVQADDGAC